MLSRIFPVVAALGVLTLSTAAMAVTIDATDSLYDAAGGTTYDSTGTSPVLINIPTGATFVTFSVSGTISMDSGTHKNDPDGIGAQQGLTTNPWNNISGITLPWAGSLGGLFLSNSSPGSPAPASLDYTTLGTGNASYTPLIAQTFFIGDGLTGDGAGSTQIFYIPTGATRLYLGYADACNYGGNPGCYNDNTGSVSASYAFDAPEPAPFMVLATALVGLAVARRRRV
ncbi:MAG TPA: hypothetical protein VFN42_15065 [Acetobacteraceae bacterium]|nr:hypothetical protein [Acetobacteraceae bacterium]